MVKVVEDKKDYDDELKNAGDKLVVVDFYADWCGPCKMIAPYLVTLAQEFPNVVFLKVNVDEQEEIAEECGIEAMPTFKFFKASKEVDELTGANKEKLKEKVQQLAN